MMPTEDFVPPTCQKWRRSYRDPDHIHVCTSFEHDDDEHACPCGDWWHSTS